MSSFDCSCRIQDAELDCQVAFVKIPYAPKPALLPSFYGLLIRYLRWIFISPAICQPLSTSSFGSSADIRMSTNSLLEYFQWMWTLHAPRYRLSIRSRQRIALICRPITVPLLTFSSCVTGFLPQSYRVVNPQEDYHSINKATCDSR